MKRVFLHVKTPGNAVARNLEMELADVPRLGDHVSLRDGSQNWGRVVLVVWVPSPEPREYHAEVWAIEVDHLEAHKVHHV